MADKKPLSQFEVRHWDQLDSRQQEELLHLFHTKVHLLPLVGNEARHQLAFLDSNGRVLAGIEFTPYYGTISLLAQVNDKRKLAPVIDVLTSRGKRPLYGPMDELLLHALESVRRTGWVPVVSGYFSKTARVFLDNRRKNLALAGIHLFDSHAESEPNLRTGRDRNISIQFPRSLPLKLKVNPRWQER